MPSQETIEVRTPRGTMPVHLARPDGKPPFPLVVVYMDAPGVRPALHDHAQRLAGAGYAVALPDLYHALPANQRPDPDRLAVGDADEFARMAAAVQTLNDESVLADTRALLDAFPEDLARDGAGWGCVGFCAGGRFGMRAAVAFGRAVSAAALLHPSRLVTAEEDSPHRRLAGASAALYLAFGENDHVTPVSTIEPLRAELDRSSMTYDVEVIEGAEHGFTMPGLPAYDRDAAERAWTGTLALLGRHLRPAN